ncbi:rubredoxin [Thermithiobacillus plumbiphilus]|uniref:Rubredoxin n=1 Tax=Thermithiobacillus plumbiphilus TaxID=1729899 RepID=A0ABU9D729_9PROT
MNASNPVSLRKGNHRWICAVCDLVYDERDGWPEDGIPPGTPFESIPESWVCPECGVSKADFYRED